MAAIPSISIVKSAPVKSGTLIVLAGEKLAFGPGGKSLGGALLNHIKRSAQLSEFKGKAQSVLELIAPNPALDRLLVIGLGKPGGLKEADWLRLGGTLMAHLKKGERVSVLLERPDGKEIAPESAADFCLGLMLRAYEFDRYKAAKEGEEGKKKAPPSISLQVAEPAKTKRALDRSLALAGGITLARDLVNEPANVLGPIEFAQHAQALRALGVEVQILTEKEMGRLKMNALLGVAQGSSRPPRLVLMRWNGGAKGEAPLAFIGKGVVFDSGGISIKPAGGMEDMKGDMAGAAAVTGLMHVLAARKAKVNVLGAIGVVENMPDGNAQRPGDIVRAMSGKTIEIINTDAEGRLVLADVLHYVETRYKPKFMIDLATLTGAILVGLGQQYAGLFSNDDKLAAALTKAGEASGEQVWRLPMGSEYDKMIDSKFADVKNTGGRYAGSITAAQFLKRFVKDTPWAHLDIAGTAMSSPHTDTNRSWASGYGVRLLDRLISDSYEG